MSSTQGTLGKELQHIKTALQACQFPNWALNQWHHKFLNNNQPNNNTSKNSNNNNQDNHTNNTTKRNITLVVPYIKGISKKFKKLCKSKGIQVHFRGTNTLRTQSILRIRIQKHRKWHHLPLQMSTYQLSRSLHRGIRQGSGGKG